LGGKKGMSTLEGIFGREKGDRNPTLHAFFALSSIKNERNISE